MIKLIEFFYDEKKITIKTINKDNLINTLDKFFSKSKENFRLYIDYKLKLIRKLKILFIIGPSSAGKTYCLEDILKKYKTHNFVKKLFTQDIEEGETGVKKLLTISLDGGK